MDHRGLRARLAGAACTSCGAAIPSDRIDVLADRGDVAFVELTCPACRSRTMGMVLGPEHGQRTAVLDTATDPAPGQPSGTRPAGRPPISADDVRAMRAFLARWHGDLRSLLRGPGDTGAGAGR